MPEFVYKDTLPGGKHWSLTMRRGTLLKLTDVEGGANAGMLSYIGDILDNTINPEGFVARITATEQSNAKPSSRVT